MWLHLLDLGSVFFLCYFLFKHHSKCEKCSVLGEKLNWGPWLEEPGLLTATPCPPNCWTGCNCKSTSTSWMPWPIWSSITSLVFFPVHFPLLWRLCGITFIWYRDNELCWLWKKKLYCRYDYKNVWLNEKKNKTYMSRIKKTLTLTMAILSYHSCSCFMGQLPSCKWLFSQLPNSC